MEQYIAVDTFALILYFYLDSISLIMCGVFPFPHSLLFYIWYVSLGVIVLIA